MANMQQVAAYAGVSLKTVSRVVNEMPNVRDDTSRRVREAIAALNYYPHAAAQTLARRKSGVVGAVVALSPEDLSSRNALLDTLAGASPVLARGGYDLAIYTQMEKSFLGLVQGGQVDALLLLNVPARDPRILELVEEGSTFVLTCQPDTPGSPLSNRVSWVDSDQASGAAAAVEHLADLGHRSFGLIAGPPNLVVTQLRERATRDAIAARGLPEPGPTLYGEFSMLSGERLLDEILETQPQMTAVICGDDTSAIGVVHAALDRGIRVPHDLSVVGFDDMAFSRYFSPPLTTVRQPMQEKGARAARLLLAQLGSDRGLVAQVQHELLPTELIVRGSTAPP